VFNKHLIPDAQNLSEGKALNIKVADYDFLITKYEGKLLAYENLCPHQNKQLNWSSTEAVNEDGDYLKCHHHGALFSPRDGSCITGPCQGGQLKKVTIGMEKGNCYLLLA